MMISARIAVWLCAVFGVICTGAAVAAFAGAHAMADGADRQASLGYAAFWGFLAIIAGVFGVLSWLMMKGKLGPAE